MTTTVSLSIHWKRHTPPESPARRSGHSLTLLQVCPSPVSGGAPPRVLLVVPQDGRALLFGGCRSIGATSDAADGLGFLGDMYLLDATDEPTWTKVSATGAAHWPSPRAFHAAAAASFGASPCTQSALSLPSPGVKVLNVGGSSELVLVFGGRTSTELSSDGFVLDTKELPPRLPRCRDLLSGFKLCRFALTGMDLGCTQAQSSQLP